jgi:hypothetical protein
MMEIITEKVFFAYFLGFEEFCGFTSGLIGDPDSRAGSVTYFVLDV